MRKRTETRIDEIISMCDGDVLGALKALMLVNEHLEFELEQLLGSSTRDREYERLGSLH
jgi:hypothetical protein